MVEEDGTTLHTCRVTIPVALLVLLARALGEAQPPAVFENDRALRGSNVIIESGQTVRELLSRLAMDPHRRLSAEDDIGDVRLDVFASNKSTAQVMLSFARLFNATWRPAPSADAPTAYTFKYTQVAKSRADILLRKTQDKALEPLHKLIEYLRTPGRGVRASGDRCRAAQSGA